MEIGTEPSIPTTPIQAESPAISSGARKTAGISDGEKNCRGLNEMEDSKSECKTPNPDEKTGGKQRILIPKNGTMERLKLKVPKTPNVAAKVKVECKTPTPVKEIGQRVKFGGIELPKNSTPNWLKVPKTFKYPERYTSPTDLMMSPISKGLLARTRKGALPSKMHELRIPETRLQG